MGWCVVREEVKQGSNQDAPHPSPSSDSSTQEWPVDKLTAGSKACTMPLLVVLGTVPTFYSIVRQFPMFMLLLLAGKSLLVQQPMYVDYLAVTSHVTRGAPWGGWSTVPTDHKGDYVMFMWLDVSWGWGVLSHGCEHASSWYSPRGGLYGPYRMNTFKTDWNNMAGLWRNHLHITCLS